MDWLLLLETAAEQTTSTEWWYTILQFAPLLLVFVVFYFLLIRPQRKRDKETQNMRNNIQVGDEVVTSGGIVGRVVNVREDTLVIETGTERSKVRIKRWAVQQNQTVHDETGEE